MTKHGMAPIVDASSRILVLGSLPGERSLTLQRYYANERNDFWRILAAVFDDTVRSEYESKLEVLRKKGVALWDVLESAERIGSLDSAIRNPVSNDIAGLLESCPSVRKIALNGTAAGRFYRKYVEGQLGVRGHALVTAVLPSTSPIKGRNVLSFEDKVERWKAFLTA